MMVDFFTVAGQAKRLRNVGATLKAAVLGRGVTANVKNPLLKFGLEAAASNPFITAGFIAGAATAPIRAAAIKLGGGLVPRSLGGKIGAATLGIAGAGVLSRSKKAREKVKDFPTTVFGAGQTLGGFIEEPRDVSAKDIAEELAKIGLFGGLAAGGVLGGAAILKKLKKDKKKKDLLELIPAPPLAQPPIVGKIPVTAISPGGNGKEFKAAIPQIKLTSSPKINIVVQNAFT